MWVTHICMCCMMGKTRVSWFEMELVYPVAMHSAEFCVICRLILVFAALDSQEGCSYKRIGLMSCLYT